MENYSYVSAQHDFFSFLFFKTNICLCLSVRCLHYQYPDLIGYSYVPGIDGYVNIEGQRQPVDPFPDKSITTDLGITGLAHLNKNQVRVIFCSKYDGV